jgi:hypothetical protein
MIRAEFCQLRPQQRFEVRTSPCVPLVVLDLLAAGAWEQERRRSSIGDADGGRLPG